MKERKTMKYVWMIEICTVGTSAKVILTSITTENYFGNKKTWMIEKFTDTENR